MKIILIILTLILIALVNKCHSTAQESGGLGGPTEPCNPKTCKLPLCKCSDIKIPADFNFDDTPMMIAITFNGVISAHYMKYIKKILNPIYKNPNNCPVQATFFVSDKTGNTTTDYCVIQNLFNNNNEIAVGSYDYKCPYTDCLDARSFRAWSQDSSEKEIFEQKKKISIKSRINKSFLRGFRTPFLDQGGNVHFKSLKKYAFNYDSSMVITPDDIKHLKGRVWPHTLNFPPKYACPTCPKTEVSCQVLPGSTGSECTNNLVWIVPQHYYEGKNSFSCPTLIRNDIASLRSIEKNCFQQVKVNSLFETLLYNFKLSYTTNKAPFVINIETSWLDKYGDQLVEAFKKFINLLTNPSAENSEYSLKNDIYFVTISKIIEWVEYPTSLKTIGNRWLWDCDGSLFDYDEECQLAQQMLENSKELEEIKKKNKTAKLEFQTEILFQNGVLTGVICVFVFSLLFTVCYDKFNVKK